jgi:hypothetical protein
MIYIEISQFSPYIHCVQVRNIFSAVFDRALELHKAVEESSEDTNSTAFQERVKKGNDTYIRYSTTIGEYR